MLADGKTDLELLASDLAALREIVAALLTSASLATDAAVLEQLGTLASEINAAAQRLTALSKLS
jgi:hypothetical protein